ncbi:MAG: 50S ribosomal protein L22 [Candidatus Ryanbacteria bacterium RIFCSPHIGHO2_02_FULL_48_12]|jgi:large subunit ribosomal protein L22|uniref:Large ribosomal subunit protein uL22 n=1 Tax=Candidatus Ryanbacteria bacterium RIFCSPHIGHO2_01_FULL_48_27 TaxID=1802115 RepID=A0A1G2G4X0_9BACT|nr:MAG: 50S ribosomal protein L22 [Candidatus Ryanbacteria bacterium RIFCSPHIGHO2_01_FULL_48_27]OGZ50770.1 MAG: 50S ribosomal protein L22 [Candidatus Ryanbacteria bacterium RIFCSPHIGHO2_02_FULL_48_12]
MNRVTAQLNYLRISPRKVRLVAGALRGLSLAEAAVRVAFIEKKSALPMKKLIRSAAANAKSRNIDEKTLVIEKLTVDEGPALKRFTPKAHGRATPIRRRTSHITLVLSEKE